MAADRLCCAAIAEQRYHWNQEAWQPGIRDGQARVERLGGLIALIAPPQRLRTWAVQVARLGDRWHHGMDYTYLDTDGVRSRDVAGEVQVFRDYRRRVAVARVARREVLSRHDRQPAPADVNPMIWNHLADVRARRTVATPDRPVRRARTLRAGR